MQTVPIDLKKNPDIADFLIDKEPGDEVCLYGTIKSLDDQTAVITIEEVGESKKKEEEEDEGDESGESDERNPDGDSVAQAGSVVDTAEEMG